MTIRNLANTRRGARNVQADRLIPCPVCKVKVGKACKPCTSKHGSLDTLKAGQSHFGRRLKRILTEGTLPEERL